MLCYPSPRGKQSVLMRSASSYSYVLPFYFQVVKGLGAEASGLRMLPAVIAIIGSATVVGMLITKIGRYAPFMWIGGSIFTVGCGMMSTLSINSSAAAYIGYQILYGIGAGGPNSTPFLAAQKAFDEKPEDISTVNGLMVFHNMLGGTIGVALSRNILGAVLVQKVRQYAPDVPARLILDTGSTNLEDVLSPAQLVGVIRAYALAVKASFYLPIAATGVLTLISLLIPNLSLKKKKQDTEQSGADTTAEATIEKNGATEGESATVIKDGVPAVDSTEASKDPISQQS